VQPPFSNTPPTTLTRTQAIRKNEEDAAEAAAKKAATQAKADAAFGRWVIDKRVHDTALALLPSLTPMGSSDEDWAAVLTAYAYTHCYLSDQHSQFAVDVNENPKRSLEHVFTRFTQKFHGFDKVSRALPRQRAAPPAIHRAPIKLTPLLHTLLVCKLLALRRLP
jgi:hypothetical protein